MKVKFNHTLQNLFGLFGMGGCIGGINEEVVHVNDKPSFRDHITKGVIHKALESGRGIGETEEHHSGFKESLMGDEGSFSLMSIFDSDIIVSPSDIEFGEDFHPLEFINKVGNEGKRICATDSVFIDIAIVLTGLEATVLLFDKEKSGCLWGVRGVNFASFRFLSRKSSVAFRSLGKREYTLLILGLKDLSRLIS